MKKNIFKELALLLGLIVVVAIAARVMARGETLEEYGKKKATEPEASVVASSEASSAEIATSDMSSADVSSFESPGESAIEASSAATEDSSLSASAVSTEPEAPANSPERVTYMDNFYYEPLSDEVIARITGISYVENDNISLEDLRYCSLLYNDFEGNTQTGEMICNKKIAEDVIEIFCELYQNGYQIEKIKLIDEFGGDDTASMEANNTSCFNYRVVDGTTRLSNHAYGLAIDLNPFYNPYITYNNDGTTKVSPEGSRQYEDRTAAFPYKIDENDLAYKLFKEHGFSWGGNWNSVKDYQHFEKK
ncbi:M15 family metallopeptidase [Butyrivibrio sp. MC2021]|uniref:M15 family metallopeptidase n=1 Tax=Butyrivibrio sp. MC2021 TaxID=1408306 RepID=UPI0004790C7C|nr:M15 family metallopeptidase [Butyrivibrio sp. MC2021]